MQASQTKAAQESPYMTPGEAAGYCRVDQTTLWRARRAGTLKASGPGSAVRYHVEDLNAWMRGRSRA